MLIVVCASDYTACMLLSENRFTRTNRGEVRYKDVNILMRAVDQAYNFQPLSTSSVRWLFGHTFNEIVAPYMRGTTPHTYPSHLCIV